MNKTKLSGQTSMTLLESATTIKSLLDKGFELYFPSSSGGNNEDDTICEARTLVFEKLPSWYREIAQWKRSHERLESVTLAIKELMSLAIDLEQIQSSSNIINRMLESINDDCD